MADSVANGADADAAVMVLLAAGESRRFGGIKQLADIDGEPMVHRAARIALATGARVIVVTGAYAEKVSDALAHLPLVIAHHEAWAEGMGSSLAAGIRQVSERFPSASGAVLCLADQPLLKASDYRHLLNRHRERPELILATQQGEVAGPPVLFPCRYFDELMQCSGPRGAQLLLQRHPLQTEIFTSAHSIDVDTPDDWSSAKTHLARPEETELNSRE